MLISERLWHTIVLAQADSIEQLEPLVQVCMSDSCTKFSKESKSRTTSFSEKVLSFFSFDGISLWIILTADVYLLKRMLAGFWNDSSWVIVIVFGKGVCQFKSSNSFQLLLRCVANSSWSRSLFLPKADEVTPRFLEQGFLLDEYRIPSADCPSESPEWFNELSLLYSMSRTTLNLRREPLVIHCTESNFFSSPSAA